MARKSDAPRRSELTEKTDQQRDQMREQNEEMEKSVHDKETIQETLERLNRAGTAEADEDVEQSIDAAQEVSVDEFEDKGQELDRVEGESQEHQTDLDDRSEQNSADLGELSNASAELHGEAANRELLSAKEAALGDIDFLKTEYQKSKDDSEESQRVCEEQHARMGARRGRSMPDEQVHADFRNQRKTPDLSDLESHLGAAASLTDQLLRCVRSLPQVAEDGSSECPFAEELYAEKEELQTQAEGTRKQLRDNTRTLETLIKKIKDDIVVVSAQEDRLHGDRAREHFSEAEAALAAKYKHYLNLRERVRKIVKLLEDALREAHSKQFPGRTPRKWPGTDPEEPSAQSPRTNSKVPLAGADQELRDLFELDRRAAMDS